MKKPLAFCGFKNVGKTTLVKTLADKLSLSSIDTDQMLEMKFNLRIFDLYKCLGEEAFRQKEIEVLKSINCENPCLISLGGGSLVKRESLAFIMDNFEVINLKASFATISERILSRKPLWQLLDQMRPLESLKDLYDSRTQEIDKLDLLSFTIDEANEIEKLEAYVRKYFW